MESPGFQISESRIISWIGQEWFINPANSPTVYDNLTVGERKALSKLKTLDQQVIKIQDKGSKFVILEQTEYSDKMLSQLENPLHYKTLDSDPTLFRVFVDGGTN